MRQLRDPALFEEGGQLYLLYSGAGEQAIGLEDFSQIAADARALAALDGRSVVQPAREPARVPSP